METNILSVLEHGAEAVESRRNALAFVGKLGAGALLSMLPLGLDNEAKAQSAGSDVDILNFALTLEYLESLFYNQYIAGTLPAPATGEPAYTPAPIPTAVLPLFQKIRADEDLHVKFLRTAISGVQGATPVAFTRASFDFTAGGMFDPKDYQTFLILSQGFEDTGVRAYKGQAASFSKTTTGAAFLTAALNIHSVEARHAAAVRKVRGTTGWIPGAGDDAPAPIKPNYAGDGNNVQGGVTLQPAAKYNARQITEAFDEPLDKATVLGLVRPFIR